MGVLGHAGKSGNCSGHGLLFGLLSSEHFPSTVDSFNFQKTLFSRTWKQFGQRALSGGDEFTPTLLKVSLNNIILLCHPAQI